MGGDVAYGDSVLGDMIVEGRDVVEPCLRAPPWSTRYDSGGGGANGVSSSARSIDRGDRMLCCVSLLLDEPVTSFQIFFKPFAFFTGRAGIGSGTSGFCSTRGQDSPRRSVGALLPISTTSRLGCCWKYACSRWRATLELPTLARRWERPNEYILHINHATRGRKAFLAAPT